MRYSPAHAAKSGSVPFMLRGPKPVRAVLSAAIPDERASIGITGKYLVGHGLVLEHRGALELAPDPGAGDGVLGGDENTAEVQTLEERNGGQGELGADLQLAVPGAFRFLLGDPHVEQPQPVSGFFCFFA